MHMLHDFCMMGWLYGICFGFHVYELHDLDINYIYMKYMTMDCMHIQYNIAWQWYYQIIPVCHLLFHKIKLGPLWQSVSDFSHLRIVSLKGVVDIHQVTDI